MKWLMVEGGEGWLRAKGGSGWLRMVGVFTAASSTKPS